MARSYVAEARRRVGPKRERIRPIIERLAAEHPDATIALRFRSDIELLVSVTRLTFTSVVCAESITATSSSRSERDLSAIVASGCAAASRSMIGLIRSRFGATRLRASRR